MKILITGTHFTPAVAVIRELRKMEPRADIVYVGRKTTQEGDDAPSIESKVLPNEGVKFIPIITGRLRRHFSFYTIVSLFKIPIGFIQAFFILLFEKPNVVLSFGGYVAVPIVILSWFGSIPIIIHEQTLTLGLANKISSYFADKIAISFEGSFPKGEKIILTGNPLRHEIISKLATPKLTQKNIKTILVMGGNQGSHVINLAIEKTLPNLLKITQILHQTGYSKYKDYDRLQELKIAKNLDDKYRVVKWFGQDYAQVLQSADLVVSRAGINTLLELAYFGKPALVIPIQNKEQNQNAKFFQKLGLVKILPQNKLTQKNLLIEIKGMLKNIDDLNIRAKESKKIVIQDAAKRLALETLLLGKG